MRQPSARGVERIVSLVKDVQRFFNKFVFDSTTENAAPSVLTNIKNKHRRDFGDLETNVNFATTLDFSRMKPNGLFPIKLMKARTVDS